VPQQHIREHCTPSVQDPFRRFQVSDPARHAKLGGSVSRVMVGFSRCQCGCVHRVVHHGAVVDTLELISILWPRDNIHTLVPLKGQESRPQRRL
jgi:hypothetical protein